MTAGRDALARAYLARAYEARWLIAVSAAFILTQLVFGSPHMGLGWDETVYISQVSPHVPTEYFSPPRARGITLLPAPLLRLTSSVVALRLYLTVLAAVGLVIAYWPWLALVRARIVALAALFLTGLWVVQFYGDQVMPNLYVAYGAVAATGWFLRAVLDKGRAWMGLAAALAFMTLMRPPDALFLAATLLVAALAVKAWRRRGPAVAIVTGTAAGLIPWLVESWVRFGGPLERLRLSGRTEGGMGFHPEAIWYQLKALNGPTLCRPCGGAIRWNHPELAAWWLILPILTAAGVMIAARTGRRDSAVTAAVCGAVLAIPYLFTLRYAAPRFLIPTYALLAVPVGILFDAALAWARERNRVLVAGVALLIGTQLVTQNAVLRHRIADQDKGRAATVRLARRLAALGITAPCVVAGRQGPYLGFYTGCASAATSEDNPYVTHATILRTARTSCSMAFLTSGKKHLSYLTGWSEHPYTDAGTHWSIYVAPRSSESGTCARAALS